MRNWQTIEFGIDDKGFGKECESIEELIEYMSEQTIDGRALPDCEVVDLCEMLKETERELKEYQAENDRLRNPWRSLVDNPPTGETRFPILARKSHDHVDVCSWLPDSWNGVLGRGYTEWMEVPE